VRLDRLDVFLLLEAFRDDGRLLGRDLDLGRLQVGQLDGAALLDRVHGEIEFRLADMQALFARQVQLLEDVARAADRLG
jgi:hypothetical protein